MKSLKIIIIIAMLGVVAFSGLSFAMKSGHGDWQEKCQAELNGLKDAAAALEGSNPDLAKGLNDLISEKEKKMQEMAEMKNKYDAKKKLLRDSAAALQKTNPELAETLWDMSEKKHMGKMGPMGKMCPMGMKCSKED